MSKKGSNAEKKSSSRTSHVRKRPAQNTSSRRSPSNRSTVNPEELRLVLLRRTGAGKSATGNTILGNRCFDEDLSMSSVTKECKRERAEVEGRELVLVDTPGFYDTDLTEEELRKEIIHCLSLCSPGPHVFLVVIPIDRYTEEQQRTVQMILEMFSEDISNHSILIFSHADKLRGEPIESFVSRQNPKVQELVERFGRRFVVFDYQHFTNEVTMQEEQRIIEETMQPRLRKIKEEVMKTADARWRVFVSEMNEKRLETKRRRKHIQDRIDHFEREIMKEELNMQPISSRFRDSLQEELVKMRQVQKRGMEEEREIIKRKKNEKEGFENLDSTRDSEQTESRRRELSTLFKSQQYNNPGKMSFWGLWLDLYLHSLYFICLQVKQNSRY